ncbi:hypothetical protein [Lysinibacillus sp. G4S2]|uniref:hypothetical protein n=1 Tax=Lysinibacillus sp. G4S2 TaxID=3055859 RepID=UPI00259FF637|nr:hypothetical protein [Lysinibacillus sp. G4S2]MDM5250082.1 hypothetical protein [Lysinibacillus sp. G4S2]
MEVVNEIRDTITYNELFNTAWKRFINPWLESSYATLNLRTGELEGHDEFTMNSDTPYLILFKVKLESLSPKDLLTDDEVEEYERSENSLERFCEKIEINVINRAYDYYQSLWNRVEWYADSIIEENLFEWYETRKIKSDNVGLN